MIPKNTPTINPLPPQRPARPYLCVATPVELTHLAGATGIDVLSCVDPIGRKVYDIALATLAARGVRCGDDLITQLTDWTAQR